MNTTQEHYLNPDELLARHLRVERAGVLLLQPFKADQAVKHMLSTQARLGDTASNHFVPKDYTKPTYEALASEPVTQEQTAPKKDAFEQALATVEVSSHTQTPEIDADLARMLVEQSIDEDYIRNGAKQLENFANSQEITNAR